MRRTTSQRREEAARCQACARRRWCAVSWDGTGWRWLCGPCWADGYERRQAWAASVAALVPAGLQAAVTGEELILYG